MIDVGVEAHESSSITLSERNLAGGGPGGDPRLRRYGMAMDELAPDRLGGIRNG